MTHQNDISMDLVGQFFMTLGKASQLQDISSMLKLLCQQLEKVPGAGQISPDFYTLHPAFAEDATNSSRTLYTFPVTFQGQRHGLFRFDVLDPGLFAPYIPYIQNLCNMLGIVLEERRLRFKDEDSRHGREKDAGDISVSKAEKNEPIEWSEQLQQGGYKEYGRFIENKPVGMFRTKIADNGQVLIANLAAARLFGYSSVEAFLNTRIIQLYKTPELREQLLEKLIKEETLVGQEIQCKRQDGTPIFVRMSMQLVKDEQGRPVEVDGTVEDITDRKQMEQSLRDSEERFRTLHNASFGGIVIHENGIILDCNQGLSKISGYTIDELIGTNGLRLIAPESLEEVTHKMMSKAEEPYEAVGIRKDGTKYPLFLQSKLIPYKGRTVRVGEFRDITEIKETEEELIRERRFIDAIFNVIPGMLFLYDIEGNLIRWNKRQEQMTGYSADELSGMTYLDFFKGDSESLRKVTQAFEKTSENVFSEIEAELQKKDGSILPCYFTGTQLTISGKQYVTGIGIDISERKKAQEAQNQLQMRLNQAQKMESIGTLAGGIAHDFNNILSSLMGFTDLAKLEVADNETALKYLEKVSLASLRARDLVGHILAFSRKTDLEKDLINMNLIIKETIKFMRASLPANIEIRQDLRTKGGWVFGNSTHIHQVFMNLFSNAGSAMKESGGVLNVSQNSITIDESDKINFNDIAPGRYHQIVISDTGHGIPKAFIEKVFDPFFSTKQRGEGTGMGLSIVYGIVKEMGGTVSVYSEEGVGTTFKVMIPEQETKSEKSESILNTPLLTGEGNILLVDDETHIVEGTSKILTRLGYEVTGMTSSIAALEKIKADPNYFDLIVTDLTMPQMSGLDLSKKISALNPDIPILLCTGFNPGLTKEICRQAGIFDMAMKPLISTELSKLVYNALKK